MTCTSLERRSRRHTANGLACLLATSLAGGIVWAGDEKKQADAERVDEVVENAAREPDDGRTAPRESWFTGSAAAGDAQATGKAAERNAATAQPSAQPSSTADETVDEVVEDAAAEADDGRTAPRESWMTDSDSSEEAPGEG
jgi:hypothetical protein